VRPVGPGSACVRRHLGRPVVGRAAGNGRGGWQLLGLPWCPGGGPGGAVVVSCCMACAPPKRQLRSLGGCRGERSAPQPACGWCSGGWWCAVMAANGGRLPRHTAVLLSPGAPLRTPGRCWPCPRAGPSALCLQPRAHPSVTPPRGMGGPPWGRAASSQNAEPGTGLPVAVGSGRLGRWSVTAGVVAAGVAGLPVVAGVDLKGGLVAGLPLLRLLLGLAAALGALGAAAGGPGGSSGGDGLTDGLGLGRVPWEVPAGSGGITGGLGGAAVGSVWQNGSAFPVVGMGGVATAPAWSRGCCVARALPLPGGLL
jgi:hypothetical protein